MRLHDPSLNIGMLTSRWGALRQGDRLGPSVLSAHTTMLYLASLGALSAPVAGTTVSTPRRSALASLLRIRPRALAACPACPRRRTRALLSFAPEKTTASSLFALSLHSGSPLLAPFAARR